MGDRCLVTQVRPKSDAESKGVKPGDRLLTINGYNVDRDSAWKMQYFYSVLRPQPGLRLRLENAVGNQRTVDAASKVRQTKQLTDLTGAGGGNDIWDIEREQETDNQLKRARYFEVADQLMVLKIPEFFFDEAEVDKMIGKARKHKNLIIDLRGNPGGSVRHPQISGWRSL